MFALGVTLFELLTGRRPYPDGRVDEIMLWHRDGRPDSLRAWNGKWSHEVSELVDAMLARDPEERPTAEMVVEGLRTRRPVMVD